MVDGVTWWWCRTVFAIAGDASNAATLTADRITFRFVLMFNLVCFGFSTLPALSGVTSASHKTSAHHRLITKLCQKISRLHGFKAAFAVSNPAAFGRERDFIRCNAPMERIMWLIDPFPRDILSAHAIISHPLCADWATGAHDVFKACN